VKFEKRSEEANRRIASFLLDFIFLHFCDQFTQLSFSKLHLRTIRIVDYRVKKPKKKFVDANK